MRIDRYTREMMRLCDCKANEVHTLYHNDGSSWTLALAISIRPGETQYSVDLVRLWYDPNEKNEIHTEIDYGKSVGFEDMPQAMAEIGKIIAKFIH